MLTEDRKDRGDGCPGLGVDHASRGWRGNRAAPRPNDLLTADLDALAAQCTHFPRARSKHSGGPARPDERLQSFNRRYEPPAPCCHPGKATGVSRPRARRASGDDVAGTNRWHGRRGSARRLFDRCRDDQVEELQGLIMEQFLLGLPDYFSLFPSCAISARHCQVLFTDMVSSCSYRVPGTVRKANAPLSRTAAPTTSTNSNLNSLP